MNVFLRPKNIIVVGGGSGIGYATVQRLLDAGANNIVIASRNINRLKEAEKTFLLKENQRVVSVAFDIAKVASHIDMLTSAQELIGADNVIDGLVISSGVDIDGSNWKGFNISEFDWDRIMDINLKGVFFLMRTFANILYENHITGNICIVSSISAHRDLLSVYQIAKHSISRIVFTYGKYLCERGVVLNCVEPGTTNTDMTKYLSEYTDGIRPGKPWNDASIRRLIRPEEVAEVIYMLMSNIGETMSGSCVLVGGGNKGLQP